MTLRTPPTHLVVFGRPGSGKSTLAERLGREFGFTLIRTGELLREAVRRHDSLGRRAEGHLRGGNLVPDALIFELLEATLQAPGVRRLLFDGFPRTVGQIPLLERFERQLGFTIDGYLEIALDRAQAVARMTGRRVCPVCGATYHVLTRPPKTPETCDRDGATLERRRDDAMSVVEVRQDLYDEHATPILEHYRTHAPEKFVEVNGAQAPDAVYAETLRALGLSDATPSG